MAALPALYVGTLHCHPHEARHLYAHWPACVVSAPVLLDHGPGADLHPEMRRLYAALRGPHAPVPRYAADGRTPQDLDPVSRAVSSI